MKADGYRMTWYTVDYQGLAWYTVDYQGLTWYTINYQGQEAATVAVIPKFDKTDKHILAYEMQLHASQNLEFCRKVLSIMGRVFH